MKNKISYLSAMHQQGVGLIEVLVAMLLLAIGVLGFAALQVKSVAATAESAQKTQAINLLTGFADKMRLNVRTDTAVTANSYADAINASTPSTSTICSVNSGVSNCTPAIVVKNDVQEFKAILEQQHMTSHMEPCVGLAQQQYCLFIAWDKTNVTSQSGYGNTSTSCMSADGKSYRTTSTCVMLEVF